VPQYLNIFTLFYIINMFKTFAVACIVAVASSTEVSLNGALVTQDYLTEFGTLRKDEPLITPEAKIPTEL
jgi:hypothetical protein